MSILHKIKNLPERKRKMILWTAVIIIGLSLLVWWVKSFQQRLEGFKVQEFKEELNLPSFKEEFKKLPELEIPKVNEQ